MTSRTSGFIQRRLSWCPEKAETAVTGRLHGHRTKTDSAPYSPVEISTGRIIADYGSNETTPFFSTVFLAIVTGLVLLIHFISTASSYTDEIILCGLLLFSAFIMIYYDLKRTIPEYRSDAIILHRPLLKPAVIPKDEIKNADIRENSRLVPQWILTLMMFFVIPAVLTASIHDKFLEFSADGISSLIFMIYSVFYISIFLFFLAIWYNSNLRHNYLKSLVITTTGNKKLVIYGKNSEELAEIQEKYI